MKKTILSVLFSAILVLTLAVSVSAAEVNGKTLYTKGDLDNDGTVSVSDARTCLRAAVKLETLTPIQTKLASFNNSDKIGVADARSVLRMAVGLDMPLPEGHVHNYNDGLGTDPTCTEYGYGEYWCDGCEYKFYTFTEPVGHSLNADGVCENCGAGVSIKVLDGKNTIQLAVNETAVVRVALSTDKERTYTAKADVDIVGLALSDTVYYNETDGAYTYLFITLLRDPVDYVAVNICYDELPNVKDSVGIEIYHSTDRTNMISTDVCSAPDIGKIVGASPVKAFTFDEEDGSLSGFALTYEFDAKTYAECAGSVEKFLAANGFENEEKGRETVDGIIYEVYGFDNAASGTSVGVYYHINSDKTVSSMIYVFCASIYS